MASQYGKSSVRHALCFALVSILIPSVQADLFNLISYDSDQDGAKLSGFIETDGSLILSESSILSWSYTIEKPGETNSLSSMDTDATLSLTSGSVSLFVENGDLKLDGTLRLGRYLGNVGGNETAINWRVTEAVKLYEATRDGNTSPSGWLAINPSSLGSSPWTIASIPEPSVLVLLIGSGSGILMFKRLFYNKE